MEQLFWSVSYNTPLGAVWAAVAEKGLAAVKIMGEQEDFVKGLAARWDCDQIIHSKDQVSPFILQIESYLEGENQCFELPILWEAMSPFQQKVLRAVVAIPYGETRSYGQIADKIGKPKGARAVGRANATNPIPLVIPCHRVVGSDGSLVGYGGGEGIKTKAWLLDLERSNR